MLWLLSLVALADPLYPWGEHTGPVLGFNPYVEVDTGGYVSPYAYLMAGPRERWDVVAGGGVALSPTMAVEGGFAEAMFRYFPVDSVALAGRVGWESGTGVFVSPEVHSVWWITDWLSWWTNLGLPVAPGPDGVSVGLVGSFAPEVWLGPVGVFLELDPEVWWGPGGRSATTWLAPGLSLWFGPRESTGVTLAVLLPVDDPDGTPGLGLNFYGDRLLRKP